MFFLPSTAQKFHRDLPPTAVFVYGTSRGTATFPGPAIEAIQGIPLSVTWLNFLPQRHILPWDPTLPTAIPKNGGVPTSVHLHSGVNPPHSDGSALAWFTAGFQERGPAWTRATYTYPNVQHSGNLWYHDHALGMIPANLLAGLLGTYTIRDPALDARLNLPSGSEFDRQLVIVDRSFTKDGSLYLNATGVDPSVHPQWHPEFFGEVMTVNGKAWPYMNVKSRKYRFRILNAGNARYLRLSLSNGLPFTVVASDSSYLPSPVVTTTLLLSPSEIADVVVDFSQSSATEMELLNDAPYPYPGGDTTGPLDGKVMKFVVVQGRPYPADRSVIPASLVSYTPASLSEATVTRYITLYEEISNTTGQPVQLYINGLTLLDPVTETPKPGTTEVWNVINLTEDNHPLHLHLASFQAVKVQELLDLETFKACMVEKKDAVRCNVGAHATGSVAPIPEYEKTWKNAVKIAEGHLTSVIVKFRLADDNKPYPFDATAEPGYVYHCHVSVQCSTSPFSFFFFFNFFLPAGLINLNASPHPQIHLCRF